jgi:hypothetical protein
MERGVVATRQQISVRGDPVVVEELLAAGLHVAQAL